MKKQNGDSKKNTKKVKTPSQSVLEKISGFTKRKRTPVKRRKLSDIFASLDRQATINQQSVVLPPKSNGKEPKKRRGRPNKSALKQSRIKKTSSLTCEGRLDYGVDQTKETSPDGGGGSNRSDQLRPLLSLLPQRRRAKSPPSINMGSCITNHKGKEIADDETDNDDNVAVADDHINSSEEDVVIWDLYFGERNNLSTDRTSCNSTWMMQGGATTLPPQPRNDKVVKIQEPPKLLLTSNALDEMQQQLQPSSEGGHGHLPSAAVHDPSEFRLENCVESLYGKEFFLKREPPVIGLHTAMMVIAQNPHCHDALKALINTTTRLQSPLPTDPTTMITTNPTHNHQLLSPPPADEVGLNPNLLFQSYSWAPTNANPNLFVWPDIYGRVQDPPADAMLPQQHHQVLPQMFMPMTVLPQVPHQMMMFGFPDFTGQYLQGDPGSSSNGASMSGNSGYRGAPPSGV
ncbi:hypothetical protein Lser_V15G26838 [Lactuca serriola]